MYRDEVGVGAVGDVKQIYLTSGEHDLLLIVESSSGENVAKFALVTGALGNVRTTTSSGSTTAVFHVYRAPMHHCLALHGVTSSRDLLRCFFCLEALPAVFISHGRIAPSSSRTP
jgi:GYD domain